MKHTNQADPLADSKREFSRAVDEIKAGILAAGEPRPKWTQDEAIAYECAHECITHMMAICTGELHNDTPTETRHAELEAERDRLAAELRGLHVHGFCRVDHRKEKFSRNGTTPLKLDGPLPPVHKIGRRTTSHRRRRL